MHDPQELQEILAERRLNAWFQPIVACRRQQVYGYEALIRGPSDSALHSPLSLFDAASREGRLVELDLLCREVAIAAFGQLGLPGKLFLNVTPMAVTEADFRHGETSRFLKRCGLAADRVVIELTEQFPIHDYAVMRTAVAHYRAMGFSIAIDDLGAGHAGLRHWSELRPDYVKVDRHFVQGVDQDQNKRQFIRSILDMARSLGCAVVAEGIETLEEYRTLWSAGLTLGQGYHFARPAPNPPVSLDSVLPADNAPLPRSSFGESVSSLVRAVPGVSPDTPGADVAALFEADDSLRSLAVVADRRPVGLLRRTDLLKLFASHYGRSLYSRRPVLSLARGEPQLISASLPLEELSQRITDSGRLSGDDDFVIVDEAGRYLGLGTVLDLLRKITELQVRNARYANPLTGLPGNVPINKHIDALLDSPSPFTVAYCDLDHFKAYNDCYGYSQGDDVILALARVLQELLQPRTDFLGHVGGDDFVLVFRSTDWRQRCEQILERFGQLAPWHYRAIDRRSGGIRCPDRQGRPQFHPIVSVSIGAVPVAPGRFASRHDIASRLTEVKAQAKARSGNSLFVDRRLPRTHESFRALPVPAGL